MLESKELPSQEYLKSRFRYDDVTGLLFWKETFNKSFDNRFLNKPVQHIRSGYYQVNLQFTNYPVHRLVWKYHTGVDPVGVIDHINRNKLDNRIENLRDVTVSENNCNRGIYKNNNSGVSGVSFDKSKNKWAANIYYKNNMIRLGVFHTKDEAIKARLEAEQKDWSHYSNKEINNKMELTLDILNDKLYYDDGNLYWKNNNRNGKKAGSVNNGYSVITINKYKPIRAHRAIYWMITNEKPPHDMVVDHIDGNTLNNKIDNLRLVTKYQNSTNTKNTINSKFLKGVSMRKNKYQATIRVNGVSKYLGIYDTELEAHSAYCIASTELHGEYANHG